MITIISYYLLGKCSEICSSHLPAVQNLHDNKPWRFHGFNSSS